MDRILNALAEHPALSEKEIQLKNQGRYPVIDILKRFDLNQNQRNELVKKTVWSLLEDKHIEQFVSDPDILTALLYLQIDAPFIKKTVMKYLRGENLSPMQQEAVGGLCPRTSEQDALTLFKELVNTIWGIEQKITVVCLDQWETMRNFPDWQNHVTRCADTMAFMHDGLNHCIFVISCLEDHFEAYKSLLSKPTLVRLEKNPTKSIISETLNTSEDAKAVVANRLCVLYDHLNVEPPEDNPTYPFPKEGIDQFVGVGTRHLILACNEYRTEARRLGRLPDRFPINPVPLVVITPPPIEDDLQKMQDSWVAFKSSFHAGDVPDHEDDISILLAKLLPHAVKEFQNYDCLSAQSNRCYVNINSWLEPIRIGICNHTPGKRFNDFLKDFYKNNQQRLVIARTVPYAKTPSADSNRIINRECKNGHRKVKIEDTELRTMMAFLEFEKQNCEKNEFTSWRKRFRPLTQLECFQRILNIDDSFYEPIDSQAFKSQTDSGQDTLPQTADQTQITEPETQDVVEDTQSSGILIGKIEGINPEPITLSPNDFLTHATFIGTSGSGKTVAAMSTIEQLLLRGIPAILIDRKGDLCSYATTEAWKSPMEESSSRRREELRSRVDVQVFTPGETEGRNLSLSIIPQGSDLNTNSKREKVAKQAASALSDMMGYKASGTDDKKRAILFKAIEILITIKSGTELTLQPIIDFIHVENPQLIGEIGHIDLRLLPKLASDLQTMLINQKNLLGNEEKALNIEELLGVGSYQIPGKTRLSIISTKFLQSNHETLFWVAQFLCHVDQWLNKNSREYLQAILMFDEADLYLPATRQPATKAPLENLLRRARSAGLGLFLATQNPGDMDYKCREQIKTWFLGRITGDTSLNKLKPMTEHCQCDVLGRLPAQQAGQFHVIRPEFESGFKRIKTYLSLVSINQLPEEQILELVRCL